MSGNGGNNKGASSTRPPLLTDWNYSSWKGKMESYICQIHDRAWMVVEDGYDLPMMTPTGGGEEVLKPKAQWSTQELMLQNGIGRQCMPSYVQWMRINTS